MSRKLASVRRVADILPIEGADKIVVAKIDGWQVVTQKGWCKPGDLVCYFEVDSFLPIREEYEFLRKSGFKSHPDLGNGFRLKTIKLRGQLSQGLIMPLMEVLDGVGGAHQQVLDDLDRYNVLEGQDLTEILGVKLYEKPVPTQLKGKIAGNFPSCIQKTDQERVQNILGELSQLDQKRNYQITIKLDGSSMTVFTPPLDDPEQERICVCSRNWMLKPDDSAFWRAARNEGLGEKLAAARKHLGGEDIALQGELMGPAVQGNRENFEGLQFWLYDVWSITHQKYKDPLETWFIAKSFAIRHVPLVEILNLSDFKNIEDYLSYADRPSINHNIAEGIVFKAIGPGPRHSFKVINNTFLLKEKD